jgi:hypothetical protein
MLQIVTLSPTPCTSRRSDPSRWSDQAITLKYLLKRGLELGAEKAKIIDTDSAVFSHIRKAKIESD